VTREITLQAKRRPDETADMCASRADPTLVPDYLERGAVGSRVQRQVGRPGIKGFSAARRLSGYLQKVRCV
jgi:hypothetical protein